MNEGLMVLFLRDNSPRIKDKGYVINRVKEHIGCHYLLTEMQLCTFFWNQIYSSRCIKQNQR